MQGQGMSLDSVRFRSTPRRLPVIVLLPLLLRTLPTSSLLDVRAALQLGLLSLLQVSPLAATFPRYPLVRIVS